MRKIRFNPPAGFDEEQTSWWTRWLARSTAGQEAIDNSWRPGTPLDFDETIWKELKDWLLKHVFHGKCAYCEMKITDGFYGDAEHYRPKGNVTVRAEKTKRPVVHPTRTTRHPGYYWLAYDWHNLLPACFKCNNAKSDQFPVIGDHVHDAKPDGRSLDAEEKPLLLYPYEDEPADYLVFGEGGTVSAKDNDPRGLATIAILNLDREDLCDARMEMQQNAQDSFGKALDLWLTEGRPLAEQLVAWIGPKARYSAAVRAYFNLQLARLPRGI